MMFKITLIDGTELPYFGGQFEYELLEHGIKISDYKSKKVYADNIAIFPWHQIKLFTRNDD